MPTAFKPTYNAFEGRGNCALEATYAVASHIDPSTIKLSYVELGPKFYRPKTGTVYARAWLKVFDKLDIRYRELDIMQFIYNRTTLRAFTKREARGTFFLWTTRHAMVVENGVVIDANYALQNRPQSRGVVRGALLITNPCTKYLKLRT